MHVCVCRNAVAEKGSGWKERGRRKTWFLVLIENGVYQQQKINF